MIIKPDLAVSHAAWVLHGFETALCEFPVSGSVRGRTNMSASTESLYKFDSWLSKRQRSLIKAMICTDRDKQTYG
jgi:hypothetical protein